MVRHGLAPFVTHSSIVSVTVSDARSIRRFAGSAEEFGARLIGARILGVARRGKFLWLPLADGTGAERGDALAIHLGMSGQVLRLDTGDDLFVPRHERVRIVCELPGSSTETFVFNDQRIFGYLSIERLVDTADGAPGGDIGSPDVLGLVPPPHWVSTIPAHVSHIARDPVDAAFIDDDFFASTRRRASAIKRILLDQSTISGIGNIYADESLWRARIHPEILGNRLSVQALRRLLAAVRETFADALAAGGTSFDEQYKNVNGNSGYFDRLLNVYGRAGLPCPRCGAPIRRVSFMNRSSHFCPRCQRRR